jgi:redox-sensitive bicupin YhaK (pirin superfamily)
MKAAVYPVESEGRSPLRAVLPEEGTARFDPFLVFHEQGPVVYRPHEAVGFPDHPHRGFETVNYIIEGEQQHRDSVGNAGVIRTGGVQWMTAASGVFHAELPSEELRERGGPMHAFQIWVNLPRAHKMDAPRYQDFTSADLPLVERDGVWARVIAGEYGGVRGPAQTYLPMLAVHLRVKPSRRATLDVPAGATLLAYVLAGSATIAGHTVGAGHIFTAHGAGGPAPVESGPEGADVFVIAGVPIGEPVAAGGPFVMTTQDELRQAFADFRNGTLVRAALRSVSPVGAAHDASHPLARNGYQSENAREG